MTEPTTVTTLHLLCAICGLWADPDRNLSPLHGTEQVVDHCDDCLRWAPLDLYVENGPTTTTTACESCDGTGFYSGPMLGRHYAGPCLVCAGVGAIERNVEPGRRFTDGEIDQAIHEALDH